MRSKRTIIAAMGVALLVAGCDPLQSRFADEGAGANLYTVDSANQTALLREYVAFVCEQVGPDQPCGAGNWSTFVQAGMNDIDQRCDSYLTWLDARRRDKEPVLAELGALAAATSSIMTVTGSSPKALNIVASAFGLAIASYANLNSRLLISLEKSTIQEVVYNNQGKFREKIKGDPVPDMPAAIYLLRNYLRLCMPITIETTFNTSTILVQRDPAAAARAAREGSVVVRNFTPVRQVQPSFTSQFGPDTTSTIIRSWLYPDGLDRPLNTERRNILRDFLLAESPNVQLKNFILDKKNASLRLEFARRQRLIQ